MGFQTPPDRRAVMTVTTDGYETREPRFLQNVRTFIQFILTTCVILMINAATEKKKGPIGKNDRSNLRNTEGSSGKNLPDYGEALFVLNEHALAG